jgi:ribosomal protein S18 acetylase RimI-like enzyme
MHRSGYHIVMTSTASDEYAQHFYRKLGYTAIGGFALPGDPYELILSKELTP